MQTFAPDPIRYEYSPSHPPLGEVQPGEVFTVRTEDCFTGRYRDPANFTPETAAWVDAHLNGVTGPIRVAGAHAGGAVAVTLQTVTVTEPPTVVVSRCTATDPAEWWQEEDHVIHLPHTGEGVELAPDWVVPARPLIGCLAVAPLEETVASRYEGEYLGNVDCGEIGAGATVILPVFVDGAGLYFGDGKAAVGDGEVVCAPECPLEIVASASVIPRPARMGAVRVYDEDRLTTVVSGNSLADAARTAFRELKAWLEDDWTLDSDRAAVLMGIAAHCGIAQVSNPLHTAKCSIDRALLPPRPERTSHDA